MGKNGILVVGLSGDEVEQLRLPPGFEITCAHSIAEALDLIALDPPGLIVAKEEMGDGDSLDLFTRVTKSNPEFFTPMVFVASPGSGVDPFVYQRQRVGFEVRYLDAQGELHTHFVQESGEAKRYTLLPLRQEETGEMVRRLLAGEAEQGVTAESATAGSSLLELGFNQAVTVGGIKYHVQTEVIEAQPLTVASTIFSGGRAIHASRQRLKIASASLEEVRREVEAIHAGMLSRVHAGEVG